MNCPALYTYQCAAASTYICKIGLSLYQLKLNYEKRRDEVKGTYWKNYKIGEIASILYMLYFSTKMIHKNKCQIRFHVRLHC